MRPLCTELPGWLLPHYSQKLKSEVTQLCPTLCDPMDTRLLRPWDFLGKSTGVGCHFLLQGTSRPRDRTQVSHIVDRRFPSEPPLDLSQKAKKGKAKVLTNACKDTSSIFLPILITFVYLLTPPTSALTTYPLCFHILALQTGWPSFLQDPTFTVPFSGLFYSLLREKLLLLRFVFNCPHIQRGHLSNPIADLPTSTLCPLYNTILAITLITTDIPNIIRSKYIYLFIWFHWVLVPTYGIFSSGMWSI